MFFTFSPKVAVASFVQPLNIGELYDPAEVQFSAFHATLVNPEQLEKPKPPMLVTFSGIRTSVKVEQFSNALFPIVTRLFGSSRCVMELHPEKAEVPMA